MFEGATKIMQIQLPWLHATQPCTPPGMVHPQLPWATSFLLIKTFYWLGEITAQEHHTKLLLEAFYASVNNTFFVKVSLMGLSQSWKEDTIRDKRRNAILQLTTGSSSP